MWLVTRLVKDRLLKCVGQVWDIGVTGKGRSQGWDGILPDVENP